MAGRLEGKVALITGAGGGQGRDESSWVTGSVFTIDGGYAAQ
jgi:NAD(P)-dependent dehydrogenase (short-subunit alcohol dehydrogenase family)